jgi:single-strand DNA-binding protein
MSKSVNKVILIGNVGKDPKIKKMSNGKDVANFSLATGESWKDKNTGEWKEKTEWHNIVVYSEPLIKFIQNYVSKGTKLYIEGSLETRSWDDSNNGKRYMTEVVLRPYRGEITMLDGKKDSNPQHDAPADDLSDIDDSIPF